MLVDSLKHHISCLEERHTNLEKELVLLERLHENDTTAAHDLKKKKLFIKDEITRCGISLTELLK